MLIIDGVKYELWTPLTEDEFEKVVSKHTQDIFGKDAKYFDLKHKLASKAGTGSIPDGYIITLENTPQVQIIELELASHSLQHIVTQVVNIIGGIENPATQRKICNAIEDEINQDEIFVTKIAKAIKPIAIHRFLSDSLSMRPIINVIIDKSSAVLEEAVNKIAYSPRIVEFQTFVREGVGLAVHAHLFEPLYRVTTPKVTIVSERGEVVPVPTPYDTLEVIIRNPTFINFHLFMIPKDRRSFFPGYRMPFTLEADIGEIKTYVTSARKGTQVGDPDAGAYIQRNLVEWYRRHPTIKVGDKVAFRVIELGKKYRLELLK